jgi:hypothetical protein
MADTYEGLEDDDDKLANPRYWKEVKHMQTSPMANLLTALSRNSTSGNCSQQGRGREITLNL